MEETVYTLCATTALTCSFLLLRRYRRVRVSLLLWCGLFFLALAAENVILFIDRIVVPETDLSVWRNSVALLGLLILIGGLIKDTK